MSSIDSAVTELAASLAEGVSQCVTIGGRTPWCDVLKSSDAGWQMFSVGEERSSDSPAIFIQTKFASEALGTALKRSNFDDQKASLFVWIGGAGYRTFDHVIASFTFIASLPRGSGVVFDYAVERTSLKSMTRTALDALSSCVSAADGEARYLIEPQAVAAMLRGLGFHKVVDLARNELLLSGERLVSAVV